jgi:hypothetical protein
MKLVMRRGRLQGPRVPQSHVGQDDRRLHGVRWCWRTVKGKDGTIGASVVSGQACRLCLRFDPGEVPWDNEAEMRPARLMCAVRKSRC